MDILELKKSAWGISPDDQLKKDIYIKEIVSRKNSEFQAGKGSRKSSINPNNVDYIRRSRFSSIADELKVSKEDNPTLINELVNNLGSDIQFYQCFRLTEEEFSIIKISNNSFIYILSDTTNHNEEEIISTFNKMMDDLQCEKFISIGHLLENMFSLNAKNSIITMNLIIKLYELKLLEIDDIKHGYYFFYLFSIVLGLVNFKDNLIDYPNSKDYLRRFFLMIKNKQIIDEKLLRVYEKCLDNLHY